MQRIKRTAESWSYVPRTDRELPAEQQTRFTLKPLTLTERAALKDALTRTLVQVDGSIAVLSRNRQEGLGVVLTHVLAVENYPPGAPQPWPAGQEERLVYLEQFNDDDVREIGDEIFAHSNLGEPEKN